MATSDDPVVLSDSPDDPCPDSHAYIEKTASTADPEAAVRRMVELMPLDDDGMVYVVDEPTVWLQPSRLSGDRTGDEPEDQWALCGFAASGALEFWRLEVTDREEASSGQ